MELSGGAAVLLVIVLSVIAALVSWGRTPARRAYYATFRWHRLRLVWSWSLVILSEIAWAVTQSPGPHVWFTYFHWTWYVFFLASWWLMTRRIRAAGEPSFWRWDSAPPRPD